MDADTVSLSNLQRQIIHSTPDLGRLKTDSAAEKLRALNPEVSIITINSRLSEENAESIMAGYDLIMDCTDNLPTRLLINDCCVRLGKRWCSAPCRASPARCSAMCPEAPATAASSTLVDQRRRRGTAMCNQRNPQHRGWRHRLLQATEAIKLLVGTGDPLINRMLTFDAITMDFNIFAISPMEGCRCASVSKF